MADAVGAGTGSLLEATKVASTLVLRAAKNGVRYASFGETKLAASELERVIEAVPATVAPALGARAFYFVPLAMAPDRQGKEMGTLVAPVYTAELAEEAICHRNVELVGANGAGRHEGVFISARLLRDQFALAFEFFINVGHGFSATSGVPEAFTNLAWAQALADVRGETSQDAWEARADALAGEKANQRAPAEKARAEFFESAFADALAIYMLSLAVDFDYAELREREYPLLAPAALAERLRLMAELFPPNDGYEFSIRYRRR